jgi:hypothetical protein
LTEFLIEKSLGSNACNSETIPALLGAAQIHEAMDSLGEGVAQSFLAYRVNPMQVEHQEQAKFLTQVVRA